MEDYREDLLIACNRLNFSALVILYESTIGRDKETILEAMRIYYNEQYKEFVNEINNSKGEKNVRKRIKKRDTI